MGEEISDLIYSPLVQRLRQIRLSNIDSLDMPGIANISRFEHALGAAYLCSRTALIKTLPRDERLILEAAALVHDTGISPFGHLAEEALQYVGSTFDHEQKWALIMAGTDSGTVGGIDLQLYLGHSAGLREWVQRTFGGDVNARIAQVFSLITGGGRLGKVIAGDMDVDNLDNVTRIAFHMGLAVEKTLPLKIANAISESETNGDLVFADEATPSIRQWLDLRENVYEHLMLSEVDFSGKLMLLYATVRALEAGAFTLGVWKLTDLDFLRRLTESQDRDVANTAKRWLIGDPWDLCPLMWIDSSLPPFSDIREFSKQVTKEINRVFFAYRIKDKRKLCVTVQTRTGNTVEFGSSGSLWLLGGGSPIKRPFTVQENATIADLSASYFKSKYQVAASAGEPALF